jgi:opacity protein-like surface antigen
MARLVTLLFVALFASSAFAQDYARNGVALGGGLGFAGEDFDFSSVSFDDTGAMNLFASYRFHPHLAVDMRVEQTGLFEGDVGPTDFEVDISSLTLNMQAFILTGQFQPYVGGGLGYGEVHVDIDGPGFGGDDDDSDPLWRLFLGLDAYVTPNVVLGAELGYNFGVDDLDDFDYWTLNALISYRF